MADSPYDAVASVIADRDALRAEKYRAVAEEFEAVGHADHANRYREAAWRLDEAAAWLRGERDAKGVADV